MAQTISTLIVDVMPRIANAPKGISVYHAANSILSLIYKELLDRDSDLIASGNLFIVLQPYDYMGTLPSDFVSMIEKPRAVCAPNWKQGTLWMAGTVTSYNSGTKQLVVNITAINGSGTIGSWFISVGVSPGMPRHDIDTSTTSLTVALGTQILTTATALSLVGGENIVISNVEMPADYSRQSRMDQEYLTSDDEHDEYWWRNYYTQNYSVDYTGVGVPIFPRWFKVMGNNIYIRPRSTDPLMITAKYKQKPADFTSPDNVIPWGLFYEVFREGVVRIITKQISIPEADGDFMQFFKREVYTIVNARTKPLTSRRTNRSMWL